MNVVVLPDYAALSRAVAAWVAEVVKRKPQANLAFAVGNTPEGTYRELAGFVQRGELDMTLVRVFQLDEYLGISPDDRRALYRWLRRACLEPMAILPGNVVQMPGDTMDPMEVCHEVEHQIEMAGGLDAAVLGLGPNGHLAFNEPGSRFNSRARVVELAPESIRSNAVYWGSEDQVPRRALTLGLGTLIRARQALLIASGEHKSEILARTLTGPETLDVPATCLRSHPAVTVMADRAAATKLSG